MPKLPPSVPTTIVKVQVPLESNEEDPPFYIYNESHSIELFIPQSASPELWDLLRDRPKGYFKAYLTAAGKLELLERVEDQPW